MSRLFTFGCSFTQYWRWPTWADIVSRNYQHFENWGMCGAGNYFILNSLIECHQRNQLTPGDTVMIMWSNTSREDHYVGQEWLGLGNIYWTAGSEYPKEYVMKFACERGYLIRDLANITMAKHLLESIGCKWHFMSMVPLDKPNVTAGLGDNPFDPKRNNMDVVELYKDALSSIKPSIFETVFKGDWGSRPGLPDVNSPGMRDFHPTPEEHLLYLEQTFPDLQIDNVTRTWVSNTQQLLANNQRIDWPSKRQPQVRL